MHRDCRIIVIAHGESEEAMAKSIRAEFRIPIAILTDGSIPVTGIKNMLEKIKNHKDFYRRLEGNGAILMDGDCFSSKFLHIFSILDLDDAGVTTELINQYKSKELFSKTCLRDYIVPIYNHLNFDMVMGKAGFPIKDDRKPAQYGKYFKKNPENIFSALSALSTEHTNINLFFDACLAERERIDALMGR